jgi:hypothetical protein
VRIQFQDLPSSSQSLQGHAVVAAGDGEEEEERLAVAIGEGIVAESDAGADVGFVMRACRSSPSAARMTPLKKRLCLGALVGVEQRVALGLVDEDAEPAVAGQPGQHADAAEQVGDLASVVPHPVDAGEADPRGVARFISVTRRPPISQFSQAVRWREEVVLLNAVAATTSGSFSTPARSRSPSRSRGTGATSANSGPNPRSSLSG